MITRGGSGIGLAFAERFAKSGNCVIICGRAEFIPAAGERENPRLVTRVCDLDAASERTALFDWVTATHPDVNVLVNNAGIQMR